jgi:hypothetical protein
MTVITNTWHSLVRRRLWPIALLLIAALVIVPLKLAKTPEPAAAAPVASPQGTSEDVAAKPVVELASASLPTLRRRVLGAEKDPFEPAPLPKKKKSKHPKADATATPTPTATPDASGAGSGGSSTPPDTIPATPKPTYPLYSLRVRFGKTDDATVPATRTLPRLAALPDADAPVLVYLGLEDGNKTAVFMVSGASTAQGDGKCDPDPKDCETLRLKVGQTEFIDVTGTGTGATTPDGTPAADSTDAQYELDLEAIHVTKTSSAKTAKSARAKVSVAGLKALNASKQAVPYVYDPDTGTLHRLDAAAFKALKAQVRRSAG